MAIETSGFHNQNLIISKIQSALETMLADLNVTGWLVLRSNQPTIQALQNNSIYYDIISKLYADGYTVIDWNVDTVDYTKSTGVDKIVENAVSGAKTRLSREYKAAVILMHDTADTVSALQRVIDGVKGIGMDFEVLVKGGYITRQIAETEKP